MLFKVTVVPIRELKVRIVKKYIASGSKTKNGELEVGKLLL